MPVPPMPHRNNRGASPATGLITGTAFGHTVGGVVVVLAGLTAVAVLGSGWAMVAGIGAGAGRAVLIRSRRRRSEVAVDRALPELIDLFVVAAAAGHSVGACVDAVVDRAPLVVRPALAEARSRVARGVPLGESLERISPALGPFGSTLTDALVAAQRTGSPLVPVLHRAAVAARDRRRRQAEEAARRLPVTLLFPLVCCVLPAFALLAVVPLLAASLESLQP